MKKTIASCLVVFVVMLFCLPLNAQENTEVSPVGKIGVYVSPFGKNLVYWPSGLDGTGGYDNDGSFSVGVNYIYGIKSWLEFETGLEYSVHHTIFNPPFIGEEYNNSPRKEKMNLISVPLTLRINFLRYFFVNGGGLLDFDVSGANSIDDHTGIGFLMGLGLNFDFGPGFSVYANPYFKEHSLISFSPEKYHQRTWDEGIRVGLTYKLGRQQK
ncbi:Outer membrane protein beta-barrel domain-containing protein [Mariniphaga anaerophila]|uniref:Outer membrane protein beta-barrel domain-containing protein n=1 Tax=Mariniphaga anaerophila TaxID=1484053 RepID=A0A1M5BGI0_9BACT|nr:outer membrane beta-barrel protein [Mariniphaga anaerophila]SHF41387.1 Outer membrane protein beta-barrel domain-containing protein [Mariniphaga anaerophila]